MLIHDISPGGLSFYSFSVSSKIVLGFELEILNHRIAVQGFVAWKNEMTDRYQYGVMFYPNIPGSMSSEMKIPFQPVEVIQADQSPENIIFPWPG